MLEELKADKSKHLYYFLILIIFLGIFIRFYGIGAAWLDSDESISLIGEIKINHPSPYDARLYGYEHPALARWFLGLPTRWIDVNYSDTMQIQPNMYVYAHLLPSKEVYIPVRAVSAIFGAISVVLIFIISKKLFGLKAAIWSAVSAAISADFIYWSRIVFVDNVFITFLLATFYFYITYLDEKNPSKRLFFMIATAVFFTFCLGSRAFTPMFLIPVLLLSQFLLNKCRMKENILFTFFILLGVYILFAAIWPPEIRTLAQKQWHVSSVSDIPGMLKFSVPSVILINIFRNSYLYFFGLVLLIYGAAISLKEKPLSERLKTPDNTWIFVILAIVSFAGFGFTKYTEPRYQMILFAPIMILSGYALEKASANKKILSVLLVSILLSFYFLINAYPYYSEYQNFSLKNCGKYAISCSTAEWGNHMPELKDAMAYLKELGNPPIMTTEFNMLTFYEGESIPLLPPYDSKCNPDEIKKELETYHYVVYWGSRSSQNDLKGNPYYCPYAGYFATDVVASFGNYSLLGKDPESLKLKIYRLSQ